LHASGGHLDGAFEVRAGETAVTLLLDGPPLVLRGISLWAQPLGGPPGPSKAGGPAADHTRLTLPEQR
jgi:hypothetical protein